MRIALVFFLIFTQSAFAEDACKPISFDDVADAAKTKTFESCSTRVLPDQSLKIAEQFYLPLAAKKRLQNLTCGRIVLTELRFPHNWKIRRSIVSDLVEKSKLIQKMRKIRLETVAAMQRLLPSQSSAQIRELEQQKNELTKAIEATYQSLFQGGTQEMRDVADQIGKENLSLAKADSLFGTAISSIRKSLIEQASLMKSIPNYSSRPFDERELPDELKKSLVKDQGIKQSIYDEAGPEGARFVENLSCHLDDAYGAGHESRVNNANLAVNTAAWMIPVGTAFKLAKLGYKGAVYLGRSVGVIRKTAIATSGALALSGAYDDLAKSCSKFNRDVEVGECSIDRTREEGLVLNNNLLNNLNKQNCYHAAALQSLNLIPTAALEVKLYLAEKKYFDEAASLDYGKGTFFRYTGDDYKKFNDYLSTPHVSARFNQLKEQHDPHIEFLSSIGIRSGENGLISNPGQVIKNVDDKIKDMVSSGVVKESEALYPCRTYLDKDGKTILVRVGDTPPAGFKMGPSLLSNKEYWENLAQGKFPVGEPGSLTNALGVPVGPGFLHDMGHFSGFVRNPEYMKALREIAPEIAKMGPAELQRNNGRLFLVSEMMTAYPKESQAKVQSFLKGIRKTETSNPLSKVEFTRLLGKKSEQELMEMSDRIKKEIGTPGGFGGLSSDTLSQNGNRREAILSNVQGTFNGSRPSEFQEKRAILIDQLSSQLTIMDHLKDSNPQKMLSDLVRDNRNSPILQLFCHNPEMWKGQHVGDVCR